MTCIVEADTDPIARIFSALCIAFMNPNFDINPFPWPPVTDQTRKRVLKAKEKGLSLRKIAAEAGVSVGTVHNVINAA